MYRKLFLISSAPIIAILTTLLLLVAIRPVRAAGAIHYAKPAATGDCSSWATACDLSIALDAANYGDEIWVMKGIYTPTTTQEDPRMASFQLENGVVLYGGFAGTESSREQRDFTTNITVLSGDLDNNDITTPEGIVTNTLKITGTNAYHVVTGNWITDTTVLDGFTITAGRANGESRDSYSGGGLYNTSNNLTLSNINFTGNIARYGGGMYNYYYKEPVLNNVNFNNNSASYGGGGLYNNGGKPTLTNITFNSNSAYSGGGGLYNDRGNIQLTNATFYRNTTNPNSGYGGGLYNSGDSTFINIIFHGNEADRGGGMSNIGESTLISITFSNNKTERGDGGGMYSRGDPTLVDVTFDSNMAWCDGGGMYNSGDSTLINVTFENNYVPGGFGGGMKNQGNPILTNVTFNNNSTSYGGGMHNNGDPILTNVTFTNNSGSSYGGGMANLGNPVLTNVTFSSNKSLPYGYGGGMRNFYNIPTLTNVIFDKNSASSGGGMYNSDNSSPIITNTTFTRNSASYNGGGIYNYNSSPILANTILWNNTAGQGAQIYNRDESNSTLNYSLVAGGCPAGSTCDAHLLTANPLFVNAAQGDLRLQITSPAIDAGDNNAISLSNVVTDMAGNPRFMDVLTITDTGNGGPPTVDLGAFEYDPRLPTTTTLESTPNPSQLGQMVTFTTTVTATDSIPVGQIDFYDGNILLGSSMLDSNGKNIFTTSTLTISTHIITAYYNGNNSYSPSTSNSIHQQVYLPNTVTTTINLTSSLNPSFFGQMVTFTATVIATGGLPTGNVDFFTNDTLLGSSTLNSSGVVTFTTSTLTAGEHPITAHYNGNEDFDPSTSSILYQQIESIGTLTTTTTLASIPNPSSFGQVITFTATVTATGGIPTGSITFFDGEVLLGSSTLDNSIATFTSSTLSSGEHIITAHYSGDSDFAPSVSIPISQTVSTTYTVYLPMITK